MIRKTLLLLMFAAGSAQATCFDEVSHKYQINADLLKAIVATESRFNGDAVNCRNSNGSCDYGFAQINLDEWDDKLAEFGISHIDLQNPCQNLHFGAWVLAMNFKTHGRNWNSVGAYNAGFAKDKQAARDRYIKIVKQHLVAIQNHSG